MSETIKVKVGILPGTLSEIEIPSGSSIATAIEKRQIDSVGQYDISVNGSVTTDFTSSVCDGDRVILVKRIKGNLINFIEVSFLDNDDNKLGSVCAESGARLNDILRIAQKELSAFSTFSDKCCEYVKNGTENLVDNVHINTDCSITVLVSDPSVDEVDEIDEVDVNEEAKVSVISGCTASVIAKCIAELLEIASTKENGIPKDTEEAGTYISCTDDEICISTCSAVIKIKK